MWQNWVNAVLGLWVIAVPFLGFDMGTMTWALVITGIVVAVLAFWSASIESSETGTMRYQHRT